RAGDRGRTGDPVLDKVHATLAADCRGGPHPRTSGGEIERLRAIGWTRLRRRPLGDDEVLEQRAEGLGLKSFSAERAGGDRGEGTPPRHRVGRPPKPPADTARTSP